MPLTRKIQSRFNLWRRFLKKHKGKYSRDELVRKFHRQYGYGTSGSKSKAKSKRQTRKKGRRRRRRYRGGRYDSDEESDYTTESE
jgi:hypothetical protein